MPAARPSWSTWPRHAARRAAAGARLAVHAGGGGDSRASASASTRRSSAWSTPCCSAELRGQPRADRGHLSERSAVAGPAATTYPTYLDMAAYTDVFASIDGRVHAARRITYREGCRASPGDGRARLGGVSASARAAPRRSGAGSPRPRTPGMRLRWRWWATGRGRHGSPPIPASSAASSASTASP